MKRKLLVLTLAFSAALTLFSCGEILHEQQGTFYSLSEAYEKDFLTITDLETIKSKMADNDLTLDESIAEVIKKDYLLIKNEDQERKTSITTYEDIFIRQYYGAYEKSYVIVIAERHTEYITIAIQEEIGGILFEYGLPPITVWRSDEAPPSSALGQTKVLNLIVNFDYGLHVPDKVTLLLDYSLFFFNAADYGITNLVAGDVIVLHYKGEFIIQEMYPAIVDTRNLEIINVEVEQATIVEYEIESVFGRNVLKATDEADQDAFMILTEYIVAADHSFKSWDDYPVGTKLYGTNPTVTSRTHEIIALYDYNPLL